MYMRLAFTFSIDPGKFFLFSLLLRFDIRCNAVYI